MKAIISTMTTIAISFLLFFRSHFIKFISILRVPRKDRPAVTVAPLVS
jgi:hypothetical protein